MTRQEQIENIAYTHAIDEVKDKDTCNPASKRGLLYAGFIDGAEWADRHPDISMVSALAYEAGRNDAIKEACGWLEQNVYHYCDDIDTLHESALVGDFRHVMKGGEQ